MSGLIINYPFAVNVKMSIADHRRQSDRKQGSGRARNEGED